MSKAFRSRLLLVVAVLGRAVARVLTRRGLDLRGGTQIVVQAQKAPDQKVDNGTASRTLGVLRRRVDAWGMAEPTLRGSDDRRIIVGLRGVAGPEQALSVIACTTQLAFHPVLGLADGLVSTTTASEGVSQELLLNHADGSRLRPGPPQVTGVGMEGGGG